MPWNYPNPQTLNEKVFLKHNLGSHAQSDVELQAEPGLPEI